ncbi:MAG: AMP-binding protein [Syntrophobacteraceae bacterium]|nr:AMP-binding protein [Syntrophobacteraceae bacterium]
MLRETIKKHPASWRLQPNLSEYENCCAGFCRDEVQRVLDGLPDGPGLNIAREALDRHGQTPTGKRLAIRWPGCGGQFLDFTYNDLKRLGNRFANVLWTLGSGKGDTVFTLAGRIPELYATALGTLKNTSVFGPLFSADGPEPVYQRLSKGDARVLVTTESIAPLFSKLTITHTCAHLPLSGDSQERGLA